MAVTGLLGGASGPSAGHHSLGAIAFATAQDSDHPRPGPDRSPPPVPGHGRSTHENPPQIDLYK
jgi:hypothetical protein